MRLKVNLSQPEPKQPTPEESEGWLSSINRNVLTPAAKGLASRFGGLPQQDYGLELARQFNPGLAQAVEQQGPVGLASQQAANPIVGTASQLASGAVQAGGLSGLKRGAEVAKTGLGGLLGGEAGGAAASALGLGERGQKAFGLAGSVIGGTAGRHIGLKRPSGVLAEKAFEHQKIERPKKISELKKEQSRLYGETEKGYKNFKLSAKGLEQSLDQLEDNASVGVDLVDQKKIFHTTDQLRSLITNGQLDVQKAIKFVQNRNKAVYDQNMTPVVKQYNKQLISDLNEFIEEAGKQKPIIGRAYQEAKKVTTNLHELQDQQKKFEKMSFKDYQKDLTKKTADEYIGDLVKLGTGQILPTTLSAMGYYFGGPKGAGAVRGGLIAGSQIKQEVKNIRTLLKENPGLTEELEKLGKAAFNQDKPLFDSIAGRINDRFIKEEKKKLPAVKGKIKFR